MDLYPDLRKLGGLGNALQVALRDIGSALTSCELDKSINFVSFTCVKSGSRFSQVYIAAQERLFLFDFWARGVMLATGQTPRLEEAAKAIDTWLATCCNTTELQTAFKFVSVVPQASGYERGTEVEDRWQSYLQGTSWPELAAFVNAASCRPELRQLFPYTSLDTLGFSRCTGYPFTRDTPFVRFVRRGQYVATSAKGEVLGQGTVDEIVDLVISLLPPGCGAAVAGTADDM